jgi:hypothetical protein
MAFKGKDPVRSKIIINGNILKQVPNFNYLGCSLSYNYDGDAQTKLARFQVMCVWHDTTRIGNTDQESNPIKIL